MSFYYVFLKDEFLLFCNLVYVLEIVSGEKMSIVTMYLKHVIAKDTNIKQTFFGGTVQHFILFVYLASGDNLEIFYE